MPACVLSKSVDDVKVHDNQQVIIIMHISVRGEELSDLSALNGVVFLPSKLQEIIICRHQKMGDIAVYFGDGEGSQ